MLGPPALCWLVLFCGNLPHILPRHLSTGARFAKIHKSSHMVNGEEVPFTKKVAVFRGRGNSYAGNCWPFRCRRSCCECQRSPDGFALTSPARQIAFLSLSGHLSWWGAWVIGSHRSMDRLIGVSCPCYHVGECMQVPKRVVSTTPFDGVLQCASGGLLLSLCQGSVVVSVLPQ